jgi:hypothetical protein
MVDSSRRCYRLYTDVRGSLFYLDTKVQSQQLEAAVSFLTGLLAAAISGLLVGIVTFIAIRAYAVHHSEAQHGSAGAGVA